MAAERAKIAEGCRVGMLTVEERTPEKKAGYSIWRCRCDCGGEINLDTRCLQRGTVTDCGCRTRVKPGVVDITGMRFGMLTALEPTEERRNGGSVVWLCRCDCGNTCRASYHQLRGGFRKSCGCLGKPPVKDYVGRKFHMLTVLAYAGKQKGQHRWLCRCDCGRETVVGQSGLQSGRTKSCGCLQSRSVEQNPGITEGTSVALLEYYRDNLASGNTSGYNGVYWDKRIQRWIAQIGFQGKLRYLGSFYKLQDAVAARSRAEESVDDFLESFYSSHPEWVERKENKTNKKE